LVYVTLVGAGGGGSHGGGGGGGGFSYINVPVFVRPTESINITIGVGGQTGSVFQPAGGDGSGSRFGNYLFAPGGEGSRDPTNGRIGGNGGYITGTIQPSGGFDNNINKNGFDGQYLVTQSIAGAGTTISIGVGGGGGFGNQIAGQAGYGGVSGNRFLSPYIGGEVSPTSGGGGGGASAIGNGSPASPSSSIRAGFGGGGNGRNSNESINASTGSSGFCSVTWD
jgi:hypothetical protein